MPRQSSRKPKVNRRALQTEQKNRNVEKSIRSAPVKSRLASPLPTPEIALPPPPPEPEAEVVAEPEPDKPAPKKKGRKKKAVKQPVDESS